MYDERWAWSRAYSDEVQTGPSTPSFYTYLQSGMTNLKAAAMELTWTEEFAGLHARRVPRLPLLPLVRRARLLQPHVRAGAHPPIHSALRPRRRRALAVPGPTSASEIGICRSTGTSSCLCCGDCTRATRRIAARDDTGHLRGPRAMDRRRGRLLGPLRPRAARRSRRSSPASSHHAAGLALRRERRPPLHHLPVHAAGRAARRCARTGWATRTAPSTTVCRRACRPRRARRTSRCGGCRARIRASPRLPELVATKTGDEALARTRPRRATVVDFHIQLDAFLARYGHRGGAERDAYHPRWRHEPGAASSSRSARCSLSTTTSLPSATRTACASCMLADARPEACERAPTAGPLGAVRRRSSSGSSTLVQDYLYYRDFERFYNDKTMSRLARPLRGDRPALHHHGPAVRRRRHLLPRPPGDAGGRRGRAERPPDRDPGPRPPSGLREVLPAGAAQVPPWLAGLRRRPARRRRQPARHRGEQRRRDRSRPRLPRARPRSPRSQRGDILVTVATDPGWTTVFSIIGGVVVETGGVVAHAVMISREYGLPCVANLGAGLRPHPRRCHHHRRRHRRAGDDPQPGGDRGAEPLGHHRPAAVDDCAEPRGRDGNDARGYQSSRQRSSPIGRTS